MALSFSGNEMAIQIVRAACLHLTKLSNQFSSRRKPSCWWRSLESFELKLLQWRFQSYERAFSHFSLFIQLVLMNRMGTSFWSKPVELVIVIQTPFGCMRELSTSLHLHVAAREIGLTGVGITCVSRETPFCNSALLIGPLIWYSPLAYNLHAPKRREGRPVLVFGLMGWPGLMGLEKSDPADPLDQKWPN